MSGAFLRRQLQRRLTSNLFFEKTQSQNLNQSRGERRDGGSPESFIIISVRRAAAEIEPLASSHRCLLTARPPFAPLVAGENTDSSHHPRTGALMAVIHSH